MGKEEGRAGRSLGVVKGLRSRAKVWPFPLELTIIKT